MKAIVSEKGQMTIPKRLRDRMGIRGGQAVDVNEERGKLVVRKINNQDGIHRAYGILKHLGGSTDEWIKEIRGEPDAIDW
jgi:antitoxin PrlF